MGAGVDGTTSSNRRPYGRERLLPKRERRQGKTARTKASKVSALIVGKSATAVDSAVRQEEELIKLAKLDNMWLDSTRMMESQKWVHTV